MEVVLTRRSPTTYGNTRRRRRHCLIFASAIEPTQYNQMRSSDDGSHSWLCHHRYWDPVTNYFHYASAGTPTGAKGVFSTSTFTGGRENGALFITPNHDLIFGLGYDGASHCNFLLPYLPTDSCLLGLLIFSSLWPLTGDLWLFRNTFGGLIIKSAPGFIYANPYDSNSTACSGEGQTSLIGRALCLCANTYIH
jgi:hypothetical protein